MRKINLLFVCLGNICRSPLAEAVFKDYIKQQNLSNKFVCDSAGTSDFHVGESPDERALEIAKKFGIDLQHHAKLFNVADLDFYDFILVMDHMNYDAVMRYAKNHVQRQKILLWRSFDPQVSDVYDVSDPYYGDESEFAEVIHICKRSSIGFLDFLNKEMDTK